MVYRGGSIGAHFKKADDRTQRRNDWFLALVRESQIAGDAWIINSPGSDTVLVETLTTSGWPDELRRRNYPLREIAGGLADSAARLPSTYAARPQWHAGAGHGRQHKAGLRGHPWRRRHRHPPAGRTGLEEVALCRG